MSNLGFFVMGVLDEEGGALALLLLDDEADALALLPEEESPVLPEDVDGGVVPGACRGCMRTKKHICV